MQWGSYARIAEALCARLELRPPGSLAPSETSLSGEFGVARNTVRRALGRLAGEVWSARCRAGAGGTRAGSACGDVARVPAELPRAIAAGELSPGDACRRRPR